VAADHHHPIHLLLTDVVMPEMGAGELAEQLRAERPDMKVLFVSGYTNDEVVRRGISRKEAAFFQKPFTAEELMRKVREVLDGKALAGTAQT
jgi:two-component system, cell cycle sensor histidine kinase and response regulator CckA